MVLDTMGGKLHVKFDHSGSATMLGQLPFFIEFLQTSGLYERWIKSAPLSYSSPNAPRVEDVLGTLFLAALSGMRRCWARRGYSTSTPPSSRSTANKKAPRSDSAKPALGAARSLPSGHNPHKPGRPSHAYHSYLMSELPLVLDVAVSPGNQMSAKHALPGLECVFR